jgi:hypothetical protein
MLKERALGERRARREPQGEGAILSLNQGGLVKRAGEFGSPGLPSEILGQETLELTHRPACPGEFDGLWLDHGTNLWTDRHRLPLTISGSSHDDVR